jgi:hypothetical protein
LENKLNSLIHNDDEIVVVISPLKRCRETIFPYLSNKNEKEIENIKKDYGKVEKIFQELYDSGKFISYIQDRETQKRFQIFTNIFVDFRLTEVYVPEHQSKVFDCHTTVNWPIDEKLTPN